MHGMAPSGGTQDHRTLREAHRAMVAQRYPNRTDIIPLFQPASVADMRAWLITYAPEIAKWPRKLVRKLWKEVRGTHPETFLVAVPMDGACYVDRNIRTVTVRAFYRLHKPTEQNPENRESEFLWEFRIQEDGSLKRRPFQNSFSEKMYWTECTHIQSLKRAFREELGWTGQKRDGKRRKSIAKRHLAPPYLVNTRDHLHVTYFKDGMKQADSQSHHDSERFPGIKTNNELVAHYLFILNPMSTSSSVCENPRIAAYDESYYQPWYHETRTPNIFVFGDQAKADTLKHLSDLGLTLDDLDIDFAA